MRPYGGRPPRSSSACPHSPAPFRTPSRRIADRQTGQQGINASVQRTSKAWQVNAGWVIAANIAADLAARTRLLGCCDNPDLREADPDTLRYRIWHIPARLARHARQRILKISPDWPWKEAFLACWQRLCALPAPG
jgi:Transposase DDE domain group 1